MLSFGKQMMDLAKIRAAREYAGKFIVHIPAGDVAMMLAAVRVCVVKTGNTVISKEFQELYDRVIQFVVEAQRDNR